MFMCCQEKGLCLVSICQILNYCEPVIIPIFAEPKSFMDYCYPGNPTHVENRTICFRLGNTWKFTSEIQFHKVNLTEVNKSYYFEGALSIDRNQF